MLNPSLAGRSIFSESRFTPGKEVETGKVVFCRKLGSFCRKLRDLCRKLQNCGEALLQIDLKRLTGGFATLTSIILTFTSTIKSRKCFITIRPMKVEIFDWSIWQYFRSRKFLILEASCSIAQLYFSHKCLWKFKCFRSSELIHTLFPKYLTKSQFTIYLIVFFTCLSIWHLSLVFSYRILATAWSWPFALSYIIIIIIIITGKCPRVELGVGFNLLEIQRDLISIFRVESSRRWRCCRAWGRCRWEQSRFSRSASSSLRSSAPGPGPQEKLKKVLFEICEPHKKSHIKNTHVDI